MRLRLKFLTSFTLFLLLASLFSIPVHAAKLVQLKNGTTYKTYDVTGDGVKDRLSYNAKKGTVSVNGKSQKLFNAVSVASKVRIFYYSISKNDEYILVEYAKSTVQKTCTGFRYKSGRFKKASEPMGGFNSCRIGRLSGSKLILYTSPSSGAATKSFTGISGKPFEYEETYKVNTTLHKIVRASNYGRIRSAKSYYYGTEKTITTNTNGSVNNRKGPALLFGTKVTLGRVRFVYTGDDASKGSKVFELTFNGKTGWVKENASIQFVKNNPWEGKSLDFYKEVIASEYYYGKSYATTDEEAYDKFLERAGGSYTGTIENDNDEYLSYDVYVGNGFRVECSSKFPRKYCSFENTGNQMISCAGVKIGMTADEAYAAFKTVMTESHNGADPEVYTFKRTDEDGKVSFYFGNYYFQSIEFSYDHNLMVSLKDGKVVGYYYIFVDEQ